MNSNNGWKPTPETKRQFLSLEEAAKPLSVCTETIRRAIQDGRLTGYRLGRRTIRVDQSEVTRPLRPIPSASNGNLGPDLDPLIRPQHYALSTDA